MREDQFQAKCFQWHWNNYQKQRGRLFHINQKSRNAIEGNRMKAMGVIAGVPDMCYLMPEGRVIWIEMKTKDGVQSDAQRQFQNNCEDLGHAYIICRTFEQFQQIFLT